MRTDEQFRVKRVIPWLNNLRWWLRGVGVDEYRALCARCGRTGQEHFAWRGCVRFKRRIGNGQS